MNSLPEQAKFLIDFGAFVTGVMGLMGFLTSLFGLISVMAAAAWGLIRLYETDTVRTSLLRRRCGNAKPGCPHICPINCKHFWKRKKLDQDRVERSKNDQG